MIHEILFIKGTVSVVSNDTQCKEAMPNTRRVPLKLVSDY